MGEPARTRPDWRTWPNLFTLIRFLLIPVMVVLVLRDQPAWAVVTLAAIGISDWADGFIARRFDQGSALGRMLDPVADRLSIVAVVLALVLVGLLPWPIVTVILGVDAALLVLSTVLFRGSPDVPVTWIGKIRSALLFVGLPMLLLSSIPAISDAAPWVRDVAQLVIVAGTIGHLIAGTQYAVAMVRKRRSARTR